MCNVYLGIPGDQRKFVFLETKPLVPGTLYVLILSNLHWTYTSKPFKIVISRPLPPPPPSPPSKAAQIATSDPPCSASRARPHVRGSSARRPHQQLRSPWIANTTWAGSNFFARLSASSAPSSGRFIPVPLFSRDRHSFVVIFWWKSGPSRFFHPLPSISMNLKSVIGSFSLTSTPPLPFLGKVGSVFIEKQGEGRRRARSILSFIYIFPCGLRRNQKKLNGDSR